MNARVWIQTALWCCMIGHPAPSQQIASAPNTARQAFPVPASIRIVRDPTYVQYDRRQLKLDVYLPPDFDQSRRNAAILVVRGGGWQAGDKDAFGFIAGQLAKAGF